MIVLWRYSISKKHYGVGDKMVLYFQDFLKRSTPFNSIDHTWTALKKYKYDSWRKNYQLAPPIVAFCKKILFTQTPRMAKILKLSPSMLSRLRGTNNQRKHWSKQTPNWKYREWSHQSLEMQMDFPLKNCMRRQTTLKAVIDVFRTPPCRHCHALILLIWIGYGFFWN